jgi:hypothetical protein
MAQTLLTEGNSQHLKYLRTISSQFHTKLDIGYTRCSCSSDIPHCTNNNKAQVHDSLQPKLTQDLEARWDHFFSQGEREF